MAQLKEGAGGGERAEEATAKQPSLWRNHDFILLWGGQVVSQLGSSMSGFALTLLILALTNSPQAAGIAGGLVWVPYILLSLPAGALVDRWDRKWVLIVCDTIRAANMASIPLALALGGLSVWLIYANALIDGCCFVFFVAAETAAIPRVVTKEQLAAANSQFYAAGSVVELLGAPLGGFLFKSVGRTFPFVFDAISYAASVVSLTFIKTDFQGERAKSDRHLWAEIKEGMAWIWQRPFVKMMALLNLGANGIIGCIALLLVVRARELGADEPTTGLLLSMWAIGGLLVSLLNERLRLRISYGRIMIGSLWAEMACMVLYALAPNLWLLGLVAVSWAITTTFYDLNQYPYRLALIPDQLQGRVNSAFRLVAWGIRPIAAVAAGWLLEHVGAQTTFVVLAVWITIFAGLATASRLIRTAVPLEQLEATA